MTMYSVLLIGRAIRQAERMPAPIKEKLAILLEMLSERGPFQPGWPNYRKLGPDKYHCHLNRDWVACWYWKKGSNEIEVYYVGSRQDAPY
jgi:plasmid maintenance system killer protein